MKFISLYLLIILFCGPFAAGAGQASFFMEGKNSLVDQSKRHIQIKKPFKRIISLYGAHTENLFSLGLDREIIGVTRSDQYPEKALTKPVFSPRNGPEKYLAARPDLVLVRPMLDRGYARLFDRLEKSGITVVSLQPANIEEMFRYWQILGRVTGRSRQAQQMIKRFKQALNEYRTITENIKDKDRVYFEAIHVKMKTFTKGAMADFVLKAAGGINIAADGTPSRGTNIAIYGKEKILSKASEIDVFISQKGPMNRVTKAMIRNEPGFHIIKAVRQERILIVDEKIVSRPTMRLLKGISDIGRYLYPDRFNKNSGRILQKTLYNRINI